MDRPQANARTRWPDLGEALGEAEAGMGEPIDDDVDGWEDEGVPPDDASHPLDTRREATRSMAARDMLAMSTPPARAAPGSQ
jgi:hypothetical protein